MAESFPDARRVAPISACVFLQRVSGNLKCNKNARAIDTDFEHPACKGKSIITCFGLLPDSKTSQKRLYAIYNAYSLNLFYKVKC